MVQMTIDDMRRIELQIMDELHRVCVEHGLTYYLCYGSLLGAKRHGGFIPWDDDMDIVMLRDDYEKLVEHFDEWKSEARFSLSWYRDGQSACQFAKAVDTTTLVVENFNREEYATGVWVDIFPLDDYAPENVSSVKKIKRWGWIRSFILTNPDVGSTPMVRLVKKVVCPFASKLDPLKYSKLIDLECMGMCPEGSDQVVCAIANDWGRPFPKDMFEPEIIDFEGHQYFGIADYDRFLSYYYGDWRTPPAEGNREMHTSAAYFL